MPELPEAETIAQDLERRVAGRTVTGARVRRRDVLAPGLTARRLDAAVRGRRIESVGRRGKNVVLRLSGGTVLVVNLGMTGRLVYSGSPRAAELRHVAVRLELEGGEGVLYDDVRRFGRWEVHDAVGWRRRERELGVEPLGRAFTGRRLHELMRGSRVAIRNWLLDQRRVAGVGNIYANEALFRAGIHPVRPAGSLSAAEADRLRDALRKVLREAIAARGTTFSDYRDAEGEAGAFEPRLRVYDRAGRSCPVCGTPIERVVFGNRSAFFCPRCQR